MALRAIPWFNTAYTGTPPWDIGRPQPEFVRLLEQRKIHGSVLDVGCGTGEHALYFAEQGLEAWGVDLAPLAVAKAKAKARKRGVKATFKVCDALGLKRLARTFDTVTDSGLFHTLWDEERPLFARSLASVLKPGGTYFMLCFSDREPGDWGPRRVSRSEIRAAFADGWRINFIREAHFASRHEEEVKAWLSAITRLGTGYSQNS